MAKQLNSQFRHTLKDALTLLPHGAEIHRIAEVLDLTSQSVRSVTTASPAQCMQRLDGSLSAMQLIEAIAQTAAIGRVLSASQQLESLPVDMKKGAILRVRGFRLPQNVPAVVEIQARWSPEFQGAFEIEAEVYRANSEEMLTSGRMTMREYR
jgi:predicted hotdog family 3-hydroxylacyl-ACP dehydratase